MKTKIFSLLTIVATVGILSTSAYADDTKTVKADANVSTVLTEIKNINKIEVRGNVELFVSTGDEKVKVYNNYYAESALVQNKDGVLRISSYTNKKLVVWVTANDLRAISAYDNSVVKSFGDLSAIELDVKLYNNASAKLDLDAIAANITLNDRSKADLLGSVDSINLTYSQSASVNGAQLSTNSITRTVTNDNLPVAKAEELAGI